MNSIIKPADLFKRAAELNMNSIAVTDDFSFAGIHDSFKSSKTSKVKLIVGCKYNFVDDLSAFDKFNKEETKDKPTEKIKNIVLLAMNGAGYKNLLIMNRKGFDCRAGRLPLISWSDLEKYNEGVICLTGDACGILSYNLCNENIEKAKNDANKLKEIYGENLALELMPNNLKYNDCDQSVANRALFKLSNELNIKPIAASGARYLIKEEHKYHDLVMAIKSGRSYNDKSRPRLEFDQLYLHGAEDIIKFFKRNFGEDFARSLCDNTVYFADKCKIPNWVKPEFVTGDKSQLPTFPVKNEPDYNEFIHWQDKQSDEIKVLDEDKKYMRFKCEQNWAKYVPTDKETIYRDRLKLELDIFEQLGFSSYMLITSDFIGWARKQGIPVGPGRGSVGGSLVGYLLEIHKADPIKYGLIFERFLNLDKKEYPDIDNDFDSEGRERIIGYVSDKYGKDYVAHVSNFITFTPKVAITDVITSLEIGGSRMDAFKIAKNITETIDANAKTIKDALSSSKLFAEFANEHPDVLDFSEALLGSIRSYATHAAGIVIGKYYLPGLVPLRLDDNGIVALEWEKERAAENGLVKIDFLGLETLNIIKQTNIIIRELREPEPENPPDYNKPYSEIYDLITNGHTLGVFQLGTSGGTVGLCNMTEPKNIEDIAIINALTRPGVPNDIKKSFIDRKFGREKVVIPHPNLERAVKATMGFCIFEESFLFLAHDFCGWNLQKSDKMRKISKLKAKGKHILAELEGDFVESAVNHSKVTKEFAQKIWNEWVIPLSGYAFNKSHSILYSMTSLHTAYLKAYYPNEFLTANLISETNSNSPVAKDNILKLRHELRKSNVLITQPDINKSYDNYRLIEKDKLITGLSALHGVKKPAADEIMRTRPFSSFEDLLSRADSSKVRAPVIQAMSACGALDSFGLTRKSMYLYCSDLRKKYKTWTQRNPNKTFEYTLPIDEWTIGEIRALETHYLGEAFTGTKQDSFPKLFSGHRAVLSINEVIKLPDRTNVIIEGEVIDMFTFRVKKKESKIYGQECCKMLLEDLSGEQMNVVFFPDNFKKLKYLFDDSMNGRKFEKGFGIRVSGNTSEFGNETSLIASDVYGLFEPIGLPTDLTQKKIDINLLKNKKTKDITEKDIEEDLMLIISDTNDI